jgi:hypothetical protein
VFQQEEHRRCSGIIPGYPQALAGRVDAGETARGTTCRGLCMNVAPRPGNGSRRTTNNDLLKRMHRPAAL